MDRVALVLALRELGQRVDSTQMRGVVDVAVLDDVIGTVERRDIVRLRLPRAVGDGAIGEFGNEACVAGVPVVALEDLHAEAELVLPVLREHRDRVRLLHAEADDVRVERREGQRVHAHQLAVDEELEIVVGNHKTGNHLAASVDFDDRDLAQVDLGKRLGRHASAFVIEIGQLRPFLVVVERRNDDRRAVLRGDLADRILSHIHRGCAVGARNQVLDHGAREPLRDDALWSGNNARERQLHGRLVGLLRAAVILQQERCRANRNDWQQQSRE